MEVNGIGLGAISGYLGGWGHKSAGDISQRVAAHIAELDADGDGQLSLEESQVPAELFSRADSDGDGLVSEEELLAMMQKVRPQGPPPEKIEDIELAKPDGEELAARILNRRDADGDGVLTLKESGVDAAAFGQADANSDGIVTREELVAMVEGGKPQGPPPGAVEGMPPPSGAAAGEMAARIIEDLDAGGDGALSASESQASQEVFDALDTNQDGVVSQAELEAALITVRNAIEESGLGFGRQAVSAAGGMAAYREEMDRVILNALTGGSTESETSETTQATGSRGAIDIVA